MHNEYTASLEIPSVDDYLRLRRNAGLTARSSAAAAAGLPHTVAGVVVRSGEAVVGMGRAIRRQRSAVIAGQVIRPGQSFATARCLPCPRSANAACSSPQGIALANSHPCANCTPRASR